MVPRRPGHPLAVTLLLLLACTKAEIDTEPPAPPYHLRLVAGPWTQADSLALASTSPTGGVYRGPSIVMAAFVDDGVLWYTNSLDSGRGWTVPVAVDTQVELDVEGQVRPRLAHGAGRILIAYAKDGAPHVAERTDLGWSTQRIEGAQGRQLDLIFRDLSPLLVWIERGGEVPTLWQWDGQRASQVASDPVDPCSAPALGQGLEGALLAAREPQGAVHVWEEDLEWVFQDQGAGGAEAGPCLRDGPAWDHLHPVWVEEGRLIRDGVALPFPDEPGWIASQPRAAGTLLAWMESQGDAHRVFLDGVPLLTQESPFRVGDPVVVSGEVWLPFIGDQAQVAAYTPGQVEGSL